MPKSPTLPLMNWTGFLVLVLILAPGSSVAQTKPTARARQVARELITLTRADSAALRSMEAAVPVQRAANPRIPAVFWERFLARARQELPTFVDSVVVLYGTRFSEQELVALVEFYKTPLGKRLVEEQGPLQLASQQFGTRWGMRIGAKIGEELAAEGVVIQP